MRCRRPPSYDPPPGVRPDLPNQGYGSGYGAAEFRGRNEYRDSDSF